MKHQRTVFGRVQKHIEGTDYIVEMDKHEVRVRRKRSRKTKVKTMSLYDVVAIIVGQGVFRFTATKAEMARLEPLTHGITQRS